MTFALAFQQVQEARPESIASPWLWAGFLGFVVLMLLLDLGVFHKHAHAIRIREAVMWTVVWIVLALLFNAGILLFAKNGKDRAVEFLTGYLIEKALSVDNIFVFIVIFQYFRVPPMFQHRVLFWGILGALIMRGIFIGVGVELMKYHFMFYIFGAFLVYTGIKVLLPKKEDENPEKGLAVRIFRRMFRVAPALKPGTVEPADYGSRFLVKIDGRLWTTPLLMVLFVVEVTDLIFAVDSIPAILIISQDPFIIYTSNIFAILGLRALYFVVGGMMDRFHYLKYGLGLILIFIGLKMVAKDYLKKEFDWDPGPVLPLVVVVLLLAGSIVLSLFMSRKKASPGTPT